MKTKYYKLSKKSKIYKKYDMYRIISSGKVFSMHLNSFLKPINDGRYLCVTLSKKSVVKKYHIHRMVAELFIENPDSKPYVNHKDGNKMNNLIENLEWCTPKENAIHAIKNNLFVPPKKNRTDLSKPINKCNSEGRVLNTYPSANEASRQTGLSQKWISTCANGGSVRISGGVNKWVNCNSIGGFIWKWETKNEIATL